MAFHRHGISLSFLASLAFAFALLAGGCASAGQQRGSSRVITLDLIEDLGPSFADAYQIIDLLRPQWLQPRGSVSIQDRNAGYAVVYLDHIRYGRPETLVRIRADHVERIEFLTSSDATTRYGSGHLGGAILVETRR